MTEPGDENGDADVQDSDRHGATGDAFESGRTATRAEAAAVLRGLADGVDAGAVSLGAGDDAVTAAVPDEFDLEVEYERDGEAAEVEVELAWPVDDEPQLREVAGDDSAIGTDDGSAGDTDDDFAEDTDADDRPAVETATVAASDGATAESGGADADDGAATAASDAEPTPPVGPVAPLASQARFEVFRDRASEWRWRLVHRNGNVIATGGEGYTRRHNAEKGLQSVMRNAPEADVVEDG